MYYASYGMQLSLWLREYDRAYFFASSPEATVINLFAILRVFRVGLGMAVSSKRVKRLFEGKLNLLR